MTMTEPFSQRDLRVVHATVRRTATSRYLTRDDVDEITGDVLLAASRTAPRDGITIFAAAIANTRRPRYIADKVKGAEPYATSFRFGVESRAEGMTTEDSDNYTLYQSGIYERPSIGELEIRDLIRRLPFAQAQAFTLCGEYDLTYPEAALMLGVSESTVRRNLALARASLQESLRNL
ncbi:sigma factor-like helix-turn-helix DNA-binding protein [Microbacterium cremeum]|uniref:sigma factor-like helix-turn-helix DNA-binding protein n=1 Tax=Microbacterium cremeum TaxID=2782169 RepID=UPI001887E833|nr:sigma factor-like helix-turn-helix DNA-binding protein [Microbacterium cremeum]